MPSATRGSIEISAFTPRTANDPPQPSVPVRHSSKIGHLAPGWVTCDAGRRALSGALCAAATLFVHSILIALFLHGTVGPSGGGSLLARRESSDRLEVRIIEEQDTAGSASLRQALIEPVLTPISLSLPLQRDPPAAQAANRGATAAEVRPTQRTAAPAPVGPYLERVNELIDRAWLRPQIARGAPEFTCHVRIDQDPSGLIENVTIEECDPNVRWRLSLLTAIRSASPLPAPADPSQLGSTLHLVFESKSPPARRF